MPDETSQPPADQPPADDQKNEQPPKQLSRREQKHLEREQRRQQEREGQKKQEQTETGKKKRKQLVTMIVVFFVAAGIIYGLYILITAPTPYSQYDLSGIPTSFVHWHADVDILICGENKLLPLAVGSGLIGTPYMHTHDTTTNVRSLPGGDGNGVLHNEGIIPQDPSRHTLLKFLENVFIPASATSIMDKKNGDLCPDGSVGTVTVTKNGEPLANWTTYIPRDGDRFVISFGAESGNPATNQTAGNVTNQTAGNLTNSTTGNETNQSSSGNQTVSLEDEMLDQPSDDQALEDLENELVNDTSA